MQHLTKSKLSARWRKEKREKGLAGVVQGVRGYELWERDGKRPIIYVAPLILGFNRFSPVGWYWYGLGQNTSASPVSSADEAKVQAMEYYKADSQRTE